MEKVKWMLPLLLAGLVIASGFGFVSYYNSYESVGEHWSPESPVAHETARFVTDMGAEGDYSVRIEKLVSKAPLFFVEYQPPGTVLDMVVHSDDGIIRMQQQFADEGQYQITVQHTIHEKHNEVVNFMVQTPLPKYTNDALLFAFLLAAGFLSGSRLRALAMVCLVVTAGSLATPQQAWAHGQAGEVQLAGVDSEVDDIKLTWLHGEPKGEANRTPLDWSVQLTKSGSPIRHAAFDVDIIHLESSVPVLHVQGVANEQGIIPLKYSPPDGADYQFFVRTVIENRVYHLALEASAEAIRPTTGRQWSSFLLMMTPVLLGMFWGWRRDKNG